MEKSGNRKKSKSYEEKKKNAPTTEADLQLSVNKIRDLSL